MASDINSNLCKVCSGYGYHERYYNEYDIYDQECRACYGTGEEAEGYESEDE